MKSFLAIVFTLYLATYMANIGPLYLGGLADHLGLSLSDAGSILSAELIACALTSSFLVVPMRGISPRDMAIAGALIVALAQLFSSQASSYLLLLITRLLSGAGSGLLLIAYGSLLAKIDKPETVVAKALIAASILFTVMMWGTGVTMSAMGLAGFYCILVALCVVSILIFLSLPKTVELNAKAAASSPSQLSVDSHHIGGWIYIIGFLAAVSLLGFVEQGLWSFSERAGQGIGISTESIGMLLGVSNLLILVGAALAWFISAHSDNQLPIFVAILGIGLGCAAAAAANSVMAYSLGVFAFGLFYGLSRPYITGFATRFDRKGRVVTWMNASSLALGAMAPWATGVLLEIMPFSKLGWMYVLLTFASILLTIPAWLYLKNQRKAPAL